MIRVSVCAMRRALVLVLLAACGPGTVEAPPLVMPATPGVPDETEGFAIAADAPYRRLFEDGATWKLPTTLWTGAGDAPEVECAVSAVQTFPAAKVAKLHCEVSREVGPLVSAIPAYGLVATDDGLWITSNAGVILPPPGTEDELTTLLATAPMRLAARPAPLHDTRTVEHPSSQGGTVAVEATIDAAARGDTWCLTDENAAGEERVTSVVCLRGKDGITGVLAAYRSDGIVLAALGWGDAPPPPASAPYQLALAPQNEQVVLERPGTGKRAKLELVAAAGTEQTVEYVIGGLTRSSVVGGGAGARPPREEPHPTITLRGTARVEAVEPDGSFRYRYTVTSAVPSGPGDTAQLAAALRSVEGMVHEAVVGKDGRLGARTFRVEHPTPATPALVAQIAQNIPTFTTLPGEPIGVGARWSSRSPGRILDRDVEVTVRSRLAERKGGRAVVVSEASIVPFAQPVPRGTAEVTAKGGATMQTVTGALVPTRSYDFTLAVTVQPTDGSPREQVELQVRTRVLPK